MPTIRLPRVPAVLRRRAFALLWASRALALAGAAMTFVVLPLAVYDMTGSASALALSLSGQTLAVILLSPIAGVLADRWSRRRLIVVADLARALILGGLLLVTADRLWLAVTCATLATAAATLMRPAYAAIVPELVAESQLQQANSLNGLVGTLSGTLAPLAGIALYGVAGLEGVVVATASALVVAAGLVAAIDPSAVISDVGAAAERPRRRPGRGVAAGVLRDVVRDVRAGAAHAWEGPVGRALTTGACLSGLGHGALVVSLVPFLRDGMRLDEAGYGAALALMSVSGVGMNLLLVGRWSRVDPMRVYVRALPLAGPLLLAIAVTGDLHVLAFAFLAAYGAASVLPGASSATLLARHTPASLHGRVFSVIDLLNHAFLLAGTIAAGAVIEAAGPMAGMLVAGVAYVVWGISGLAMCLAPMPLRDRLAGVRG